MYADLCYALDPAEFVRGPVTARLCQLSTFVEASFVFAVCKVNDSIRVINLQIDRFVSFSHISSLEFILITPRFSTF